MSYDELIKLLKTAESAEEIDKYREDIAELMVLIYFLRIRCVWFILYDTMMSM